jgi:hypothetical protein
MTTNKSTKAMTEQEELLSLENRKVKALEKIANTMDALTVWFEEIDKEEWSNRIQYYLAEWHNIAKKNESDIDGNS